MNGKTLVGWIAAGMLVGVSIAGWGFFDLHFVRIWLIRIPVMFLIGIVSWSAFRYATEVEGGASLYFAVLAAAVFAAIVTFMLLYATVDLPDERIRWRPW